MTNTAAVAQPFTLVDSDFARRSPQHVVLTEVFHVNGAVVQTVVDRDSYHRQSGGRVSVLTSDRKWTVLASISGADLAELVGSPYGDDAVLAIDMSGVSVALIRRAVAILSV
jgi:hypothetical protein